MASLCWEGKSARVQWFDVNRKRKGIRLGPVSKRRAEQFRSLIHSLEAAQFTGFQLEPEILHRVAKLPPDVAHELAEKGLIEPRMESALGDFLDAYVEARPDVKPNTRLHWHYTIENLKAFFGADRRLETITAADADDFKLYLEGLGQSSNTVAKRIRNTRQFFRRALKARMIQSNPFEEVKAPASANRARDFFVTREITERIIAACEDVEWKVIIALARFGGLRTPSETLSLTWGDIDFEAGRMIVRSPKTEHHPGKDRRIVPLFPELRAILEAAQAGEAAVSGAVHVITRYRDTRSNLRTQAHRIIRSAGLTPWEKVFQNMRASRETELMEEFPAHVVHQWIGHSRDVADKHYLQVTEDHFDRAGRFGAPLVQNPVHGSAELRQIQAKTEKGRPEGSPVSEPVLAGFGEDEAESPTSSKDHAGPPGIEPGTF